MPRAVICVPGSWRQRCAARAMAQRAREVVYREGVGWVMQFVGTADAIALTHCPYCGGELPRLRMPDTDAGWLRLLRAIMNGDDAC